LPISTDVFQPIGVLFWQVFGEGVQLTQHRHAFSYHTFVCGPVPIKMVFARLPYAFT